MGEADLEATQIRIGDMLLARWFMEEFGHGASGKSVPEWVFNLGEERILAFLKGLLDTDGWLHWDENAAQIEIQLDNRLLIHQIHLLCNRVGIKTQIKKRSRQARNWSRKWKTAAGWQEKTYQYGKKDFWGLSCCSTEDVKKWAEQTVKGEGKLSAVNRAGKDTGWSGSKKLLRKIKETQAVHYKGIVYSFDVEDDESLVTHEVLVHNCMRILVFRDKIRQAETSIASRHMTPIRIVWAEGMDVDDIEELRDQVDMALADPDFSIVTNFQVNWEEMGSDTRVPDWSNLYDRTDRQMYSGLGVTESLLSGESSYSGDRINLEVINTRYMLLREILQDFIEEQLFKPMCRRMGFIEADEYDDENVIYPSVSFTRLALRDNSDTFDHLFNLYQKGSLDIEIILELLNIDPERTREKVERDLWTVNDPTFNEMVRGVYNDVAAKLVEGTEIVKQIAEKLGLEYEPPKDDGGRF